MTEIQRGHEHEGRSAVLTLNTALLDGLSPADVTRLVDALVDLGRERADEGDVADRIAELFRDLGAEQAEPVVARMAENLRASRTVTVVTDDGRVLHGDPDWNAATNDPDVESTEDPMHPDRPLYS